LSANSSKNSFREQAIQGTRRMGLLARNRIVSGHQVERVQ
jgi:hypothetical protein